MKKYLTLVNIISFLILVTAFVVRVWGLDRYPVGFTRDEASFGYDAYSLLKTGKDQWGEKWPLVLRSFGDFKLPLYSYLAIPSVAVFGLNEFATRLPNAIFGSFAVIVTYLMVLEMTKNKKLALLSSFFLAISPWHISLSRGAFEANLSVFFMTGGLWCFLKGIKNKKWMSVSSLFLGLNLFSYHSARLLTPLIYFVAVVLFYSGKFKLQSLLKFIKDYKLAVGVFFVFLALAGGTMFLGGGKRGADILITNPTDKWESVSVRRYEAVLEGLPDSISRIYSSKAVYNAKTFITNYLSYLSPTFLFTQGAGEWSYGMIPGRGVLYLTEILFVIFSFIAYVKGKKFKGMKFLIIWFLIGPIPAALTKGPGFAANRAAVIIPSIQIISAYGVFFIGEIVLKKYNSNKAKLFYISVILVLFMSFITFLEDYFFHTKQRAAAAMLYGTKEMIERINGVVDNYDRIRISRLVSVPHIWVMFYNKWDPVEVQEASIDWLRYEKEGLLYLDQLGDYALGKYVFRNIYFAEVREEGGTLFVGKPVEFQENINPLRVVYYPDGNVAYKIVESEALR